MDEHTDVIATRDTRIAVNLVWLMHTHSHYNNRNSTVINNR